MNNLIFSFPTHAADAVLMVNNTTRKLNLSRKVLNSTQPNPSTATSLIQRQEVLNPPSYLCQVFLPLMSSVFQLLSNA